MSDNQGNPLQGSETDVQKAQKAINGLLEPKQEAKAEEPKEECPEQPEVEDNLFIEGEKIAKSQRGRGGLPDRLRSVDRP